MLRVFGSCFLRLFFNSFLKHKEHNFGVLLKLFLFSKFNVFCILYIFYNKNLNKYLLFSSLSLFLRAKNTFQK